MTTEGQISRSLLAAAAAAAMFSGAAFAQNGTASKKITIEGTVPAQCYLSPATGQGSNVTYSDGQFKIEQMIDPETGKSRAATMRMRFEQARCNTNSVLVLEAEKRGLVVTDAGLQQVSGSVEFLGRVPYVATVKWGSIETSLDSATSAASSVDVNGANDAELTVDIVVQEGVGPLHRGDFQEALTLIVRAMY